HTPKQPCAPKSAPSGQSSRVHDANGNPLSSYCTIHTRETATQSARRVASLTLNHL
ncbi:hypothetical protein BDZ89DRAFT_1080417, partial [Hymenopellis radicata]